MENENHEKSRKKDKIFLLNIRLGDMQYVELH